MGQFIVNGGMNGNGLYFKQWSGGGKHSQNTIITWYSGAYDEYKNVVKAIIRTKVQVEDKAVGSFPCKLQ